MNLSTSHYSSPLSIDVLRAMEVGLLKRFTSSTNDESFPFIPRPPKTALIAFPFVTVASKTLAPPNLTSSSAAF